MTAVRRLLAAARVHAPGELDALIPVAGGLLACFFALAIAVALP